ncbi:YceI family protein [Rhodohalobacter sulfatireducens]|uniref:YceI family protein n=1 Tax=Rhodohalobacter sulfatireducens TaxID=2911366 RepID=A0ABS9KHH7_9BACT|nr:YceI family protein [Rhodohalobacter sulfatireducens]MCG2590309.1 YceI family protein [Rhodohalobacter sulfatireducens]
MKVVQKTIITLFAILMLAASQAFATDGNSILVDEWNIDTAHSNINFTITHFFTPVDGSFEEYSSEINFDPSDLENSSINVTIPVSSINTENERRDNHLKSEDFFNASEWPNIQFESNEIEQTGDNQFVAHGELTIRDVTREFELPFELLGVMDHPMQEGKKVAGITASAQLNRTDYGVGVGDWAATAVVGDEVNIQLNLELTAPKDDMASN